MAVSFSTFNNSQTQELITYAKFKATQEDILQIIKDVIANELGLESTTKLELKTNLQDLGLSQGQIEDYTNHNSIIKKIISSINDRFLFTTFRAYERPIKTIEDLANRFIDEHTPVRALARTSPTLVALHQPDDEQQ